MKPLEGIIEKDMVAMQIDPETLLVSEMTDGEERIIVDLCREIILHGHVDMDHPIVTAWMSACGFSEDRRLMVYSTVMPARFLLSCVLRNRALNEVLSQENQR